jgi:hypothetical protein
MEAGPGRLAFLIFEASIFSKVLGFSGRMHPFVLMLRLS